MAVLNEILVGRFNRSLQKLTGIKGTAPVPQLASELMPVLPIHIGAESLVHQEWERFGNSVSVTGVAAQVNGVRWRNPANSNVIAVFEKLTFSAGANDFANLIVGVSASDLTTVNSTANLRFDGRGRVTQTLVFSSQQNVSPPNPIQQGAFEVLASTCYDLIRHRGQEIVLVPGDALTIINTVVNTRITVSAHFRERFLEPSEATK